MITKKIKVEEQDMRKLEAIYYDFCNIRDTVGYMVDMHRDDPEFLKSASFVAFRAESAKAFKEYEEVKAVITLKYIPEELILANNYEWTANFETNELEITPYKR